MTQTQLEYAIASGQFTVTVLPTRLPKKSELICSRVGVQDPDSMLPND